MIGVLMLAAWVAGSSAQAPKGDPLAKRYGIAADPTLYPQGTPKEALQSVINAIERKRIAYLLAQLADPDFVDARVKTLPGKFDDLIQETTKKLSDDPRTLKELQHFLKDSEWEQGDATATATLKDVKDRRIYMRKVGNRWFLENRMKPDAAAK
jgi:hypothetical protein